MIKNIRIKYINLPLQHQSITEKLLQAVEKVLKVGDFIQGEEVQLFEKRFAEYCGCKYAVGVANGTDALILTMKALEIGPGDEVITVPNSFLATASSIALVGARPVFVDVRDDLNINPYLIEEAITSHTKAIIPVHLTGRPADMQPILEIAQRNNLWVIEDAAQAVGAMYHEQRVGSFGIAGCFSLHPLKNLNACGDGGIITTDDDALYEKLLKFRNHGLKSRDECEFWGHNSRLDTIQAAMLNVKLNYLAKWTEERRQNAAFYQERLGDIIQAPVDKPYEWAVYHTFVIQCERRDELQRYLLDKGIETKIHYPIPIHLQEAARYLGYKPGDFPIAKRQAGRILTLPVYPELTEGQKEILVTEIRRFYA